MNRILEIWSDLEKANTKGLLKKMYSNDTCQCVYGIFKNPERYCGIAISVNKNNRIDISPFSNLQDLKVSLYNDSSFENHIMLVIELLDYLRRDVFAVLCDDLVLTVSTIVSEQSIIKAALNQLEKWKSLFEKYNSIGLTPAEQQGLFGELSFLQKYLSYDFEQTSILNTWVGVDKALRDFQYNNWALEVKTTSGNNHQKVSISSERQLDESLLENLFMYHLSVEVAKGNGENLNNKIISLRQTFENNSIALNIFNAKLFEVGYFDKHAEIYKERCYQIRHEHFYKIEKDFPRIKEKEIRDGVGDVKYTVILSQCNEYVVSEDTIFNTLNYE
jgi:hypothetical protein